MRTAQREREREKELGVGKEREFLSSLFCFVLFCVECRGREERESKTTLVFLGNEEKETNFDDAEFFKLGKETMAPSINTEILENIDAYSLRVFTIAAFLRLLIDSEGKNKSKFCATRQAEQSNRHSYA